MYACMCIYKCTYTVYVYMCICIYIYMYIHTDCRRTFPSKSTRLVRSQPGFRHMVRSDHWMQENNVGADNIMSSPIIPLYTTAKVKRS